MLDGAVVVDLCRDRLPNLQEIVVQPPYLRHPDRDRDSTIMMADIRSGAIDNWALARIFIDGHFDLSMREEKWPNSKVSNLHPIVIHVLNTGEEITLMADITDSHNEIITGSTMIGGDCTMRR